MSFPLGRDFLSYDKHIPSISKSNPWTLGFQGGFLHTVFARPVSCPENVYQVDSRRSLSATTRNFHNGFAAP